MGPKTLELKQLCTKLGRKYVGFKGDPRCPIWLVGEAPGADEDQMGIPFVGSSGRELDRMLAEAGIAQSLCCWTNPYKVRPPENDIDRIEEVGITKQLFEEQFYEELREYSPPFIIPLGATALQILCSFTIDPRDKETKISKWKGSILQSELLRWSHQIIPNYHPAYILREWSDRAVSIFIFSRVLEEFNFWNQNGKHQPLPERELIANPSFGEAEEFLKEMLRSDTPISIDIELLARRVPIAIAFSNHPSRALSLGLFEKSSRELTALWRLVDEILATKDIVGQNFSTFDVNWLEALGLRANCTRLHDTLVMHHTLHPEMSHKLDFIGMQYTRQPFWKDEGRGWTLKEGMTKLKRYNALDAAVTLEAFERMSEEFLEIYANSIGQEKFDTMKKKVVSFGLEQEIVKDTQRLDIRGDQNLSTSLFMQLCSDQFQKEESYIINAKDQTVSIQNTSNLSQEKSIGSDIEGQFVEKDTKSQKDRDMSQGKEESYAKSAQRNRSGEEGTEFSNARNSIRNLFDFYRFYAMPLARKFHDIDKRGIQTSPEDLRKLREDIIRELDERCVSISKDLAGRPVVYSTKMADNLARQLKIDSKGILNIASVPQLKSVLKDELHIKLKTDRKTGKETTGEESLNEAFAATGNPVLKHILRTRELNKILGTYVDAELCNDVFYSCYSVTGTVTGRRASRKTFLGFGSNGQNQPKHSDLGEKFNAVFVARPGRIFVACDQASAEEWIVQGIIADVSGDVKGIRELQESIRTGVSRHAVLASAIFGLSIEQTNNKECLEYFLGKKVRHAGNYDMRENTMAAQLAAAGFPVKIPFCAAILAKFHEVEPSIRGVFHKYVEHELCTKRLLRTPLGRERVFYGIRPYGDNSKVFREGYAYIPQSTIGDNNGLAVLYCQSTNPGSVLADGHDSMLTEVEDTYDAVLAQMKLLLQSYDRIIKFPNGFEVKIPIDFRTGYSMKGLKKCPDPSKEIGCRTTYDSLQPRPSVQSTTTSGQEQSQSQPLLSGTSGLAESSAL